MVDAVQLPYVHCPRCSLCGDEREVNGSCYRCDPRPPREPLFQPVHDPQPRECPDTSLDSQETYVLIEAGPFPQYDPNLKSSYHSFRHSGWSGTRARTRTALNDVAGPRARLDRFDACGSHPLVFRHKTDPDRFQVRSQCCRDRWCVPCSRERARQLAATLADHVRERQCRFITLTLKSADEPLLELIDKLLNCFRKLRRNRLWLATQHGGAAFLEVKWNPGSNRWHPHLHIVTEGRYLAKAAIRKAWYQITGDSFIVDIRLVKSRQELCSYVTKYVASPVSHSVTNSHDLLTEAIRALHGRRTVTTFGNWRGVCLVAKPTTDEWLYYGTWTELQASARAFPWGEERRVLAAILEGKPPKPWKNDDGNLSRAPPG